MTYYTPEEARLLVIEAGLRLVETKLIARTWGNVSARISNNEFIITPSGRAYESLNPEELVRVRIDDGSYHGSIKPSSEHKLHAAVYALRPEIKFIVHTHQHYASAICAEEKSVPFAPCAGYGLPGSEQLKEKVAMSVAINKEHKAFLMAKHGALCLGESYEEAFDEAMRLEENSHQLFAEKSRRCSAHKYKQCWLDDYAQLVGPVGSGSPAEAEAVALVTDKNRAAAEYVQNAKPISTADALLQRGVYVFKYSKLKKG